MGAMRTLVRAAFFLMLFGLLFSAQSLWAGEPMEEIKKTTGRILGILGDPALRGEENEVERRRRVREAVDERFDWEDISRRSLTTQWHELSGDQQTEFTRLFGILLERTYMNRLENYTGEEVRYLGEEQEGSRAKVRVSIVTKKNQDIPVEYRLKQKGGTWLVNDILIEGVSMVRNYRNQFSDILMKSSYEDLLERLKAKVEEGS